jgi:hypothetical protein
MAVPFLYPGRGSVPPRRGCVTGSAEEDQVTVGEERVERTSVWHPIAD